MKHLLFFLISITASMNMVWPQVVISNSMDLTDGALVSFPIHLRTDGTAPSSLEFEFAFEPASMTLIGIDPGENLKSPLKNLQYHSRQENGKTYLKIIIWGTNRNLIPDGPVCFLRFKKEPSSRQYQGQITSSSAADLNGRSLLTLNKVPDKKGLSVSRNLNSHSSQIEIVSGFDNPVDLYLRRIMLINGVKKIHQELIQVNVTGTFVLEQSIVKRRPVARILVLAVKTGGDPDNEMDRIDIEEIQTIESTGTTRYRSVGP